MGLPVNPVRRGFFRFFSSMFASISSVLLSIYQATLEFEVEGDDQMRLLAAQKKNFIFAVWHTFVDGAVFCLHSRDVAVYSDHPRTHDYQNSWKHFFREIGIKTVRTFHFDVLDASLGKQSAGIINFIKMIKEGKPALVAPDGPDGPIYKAKPGVLYMAKKAECVVLPIGFGFSRMVIGPNWDDFALPLPFSRVAVVFGEPIDPSRADSEQALESAAQELEKRLDQLCFRANEIIFGKA